MTEAARVTPRPIADVKPTDGARGLSQRATRAWIDALEVSEVRKNGVILASVASYERCRVGGAPDAGADAQWASESPRRIGQPKAHEKSEKPTS